MRYGGAVALIVIGAVLYFAVSFDIQGINLSLIGLICMVAGAIWLVINLIMDASERRRRVVPVQERREIIEE